MVDAASLALLILAYLSAVIDGTLQDKGLYPSSPGRTGVKRYARQHPWILVGAACGIAGSVLAVVEWSTGSPRVGLRPAAPGVVSEAHHRGKAPR